MSTKSGRYVRIKKGTFTVSEMGSFALKMGADEIDTTAFGSEWKKSDVGFKGWSVTIAGFYDPDDSGGQGALDSAFQAGSLINDLALYVDNTSYWIPDTTTDASAGCRITSYEIGHTKNGVGSFSMTLSGSGPITFV